MLHKLGRFLQVLGLLIAPVGIAGNLAARRGRRESDAGNSGHRNWRLLFGLAFATIRPTLRKTHHKGTKATKEDTKSFDSFVSSFVLFVPLWW